MGYKRNTKSEREKKKIERKIKIKFQPVFQVVLF